MKKLILLLLLLLVACSAETGESAKKPDKISFEVTVKDDEVFNFELDPEEAVSYETLRENQLQVSPDNSNWRSYFDLGEMYLEHYEYENGEPSSTYMKGTVFGAALNNDYYYVDNLSRNSIEWRVFIDGSESRTMINDGVRYDPVRRDYLEEMSYSGADPLFIMIDFVNNWDEMTREEYTGEVRAFDLVSIKTDLNLLKSAAVEFRKVNDDISYFAAYDSPEEFFVIFIQNEGEKIDKEKEYDGAIYHSDERGGIQKYTGYDRFYLWSAVIEMLKVVNG